MMKLVLCFIAFLFAVASSQPCVPANGAAFTNVIGQPDFVSTIAGTGANQFFQPYSVTVDPTTRKFFVSDGSNHRIQRFPSTAAFLNSQAAEATFGTGVAGCTQNQLNGQAQIAWYQGALYIADYNNHRTVRLSAASSAASGTAWDGVFGETSFTSCISVAGIMSFPIGVALDFFGNLYVADQSPVIYKFNAANTKASQLSADLILGTVGTFSCTQNTFTNLQELYVDPFTSTLFAADFNCNRVLGFSQVHAKVAGGFADFAVGQPSFTGVAAACAANGFLGPRGVNYNQGTNTLFVADSAGNRVLGFPNFINLATGAANTLFAPSATIVLGQTTFVTCALSPAANSISLSGPVGLYYFNAGVGPQLNLLIADAGNNRVVRAECPPSTSPSVTNSGSNSASNAPSHSGSNSGSNSFTQAPSRSISFSPSGSQSGAPSPSNSWSSSGSTSPSQSTTETQSFSPSTTSKNCGNAVVNSAEQCDPGVGKFGFASCCNFNCRWKEINSKCGKKPAPPACLTLPRCSLDITTGAVFCKPSKNRKPGKTCKITASTFGICNGSGLCVPKV